MHANDKYEKAHNWSGYIFGIGLAGFIDEIIFHQFLQWHHFYDQMTKEIGLLSDGVLNAMCGFFIIFGLFLLADSRRKYQMDWKFWIGRALMGMGSFQVYDGIINHKILKMHQIRYVDNVITYDVIWMIVGLSMIIIGYFLSRNRKMKQYA
ncbi:DUF2243 domain-containing protein [Macrococcoides goetzii]|uniref:DUF2243 domain-containing protein n=1 Tax=Macrococcoides bohemicum TaxID=1903056 RepID=UPI0010593D9E|nr:MULTISPECIES: DUF2243 domain-containing protein [Macrococcus]TDL38331.1 DUF2243 domain-containing protein [Macrococcus bohemicus]TDM40342.1 DUF2243 domain-containing protein [Macrococcus goetzii]TDM45644.1 DUF2243 domain-containing protein [Macrococcus goetzii]TDM48685.1 DUF2243 domain-containing protein [Macrococcus goetzii]